MPHPSPEQIADIDAGLDAFAGEGCKIFGGHERDAARFGTAHDGFGKGVFASPLETCGETEEAGFIEPRGGADADQFRLALC